MKKVTGQQFVVWAAMGALLVSGCGWTWSNKSKSGPTTAKVEAEVVEDQVVLLREEIGALRDQVAQVERSQDDLQAQVSQAGSRSAKMRVVSVTTKKWNNRRIQQALSSAGYYKNKIDGKIGPKTKTAIKAFQRAEGLRVDGVVGPQTRTALAEHLDD